MGSLILEVPLDAAGTYVFAPDPDPNNTFMTNVMGDPVPDVALTSACITILLPGRCCSAIGCQDDVTEVECPEPNTFTVGETCDGERPCPSSCPPGRCCFNYGPGEKSCEDDISELDCSMRPGPTLFSVFQACGGEDACPECLSDIDCASAIEVWCVTIEGCDEFGQ